MNPIQKIEKTRLVDDFIKVDRLEITAYDETFERLLVLAKNAVCVLVKNTDSNRFYFVQQMRACKHQSTDPTLVEAVAGMLDKEEDLADAVKRECLEEIGYEIENLKFWGDSFSAPGIITERMHFYYAETKDALKQNEGGGLDSENEHIEVISFSEKELLERLMNNSWDDSKTVLLVQRYFLEQSRGL